MSEYTSSKLWKIDTAERTFNCRYCNKLLTKIFVDLGHQPPSNAFIRPNQKDLPETYYPLRVYVCDCGLVQLPNYVNPENLFTDDYPYHSSQSPANISHAKELVNWLMDRFHPERVIEIGSNDGYLLQHFPSYVQILGVEPSAEPARVALDRGIPTLKVFFNDISATTLFNSADIICSINTFAHQPDLHSFVRGLKQVLKPNGVTIHEFPHLYQLIMQHQFDTIYHEHYSYFSLSFICRLFEAHDMQVFDVEEIPEHGGSLRIFAQHENSGYPVTGNVYAIIAKEAQLPALCYEDFQKKVNQIKNKLLSMLYHINEATYSVVAYGAAAKGNTLLNSCNIKSDLIQFVVDRSSYKQECLLPGSRIPVKTEQDLKNFKPDYVFILPWNLKEEIMNQLSYIREWGGNFIISIPDVEIA